MRQLSDQEVYKLMNKDPKWDIEKQILSIKKPALDNELIDSDLYDFLYEKTPKTPALYLLQKVHKNLIKPPGRPIVSGKGSILNNISIFLDKVLRDYAIQSKSYIRDTSDFLLKIAQLMIPESAILASFDVVSLYTSIDHDRGNEAVRKALDKSKLITLQKKLIY